MSEETSHNGNHRSQSDPDENWPPSAPLEELADAWLAGEDDLSALPPIGAELLNDLLELLVSDPQGLIPEQLRMFSDLSRQDAVVVRQTWPQSAI